MAIQKSEDIIAGGGADDYLKALHVVLREKPTRRG